MNDRESVDPAEVDEQQLAQLLRAAGPRSQMPNDMAQRLTEHFDKELNVARQRRRGWRPTLALAASVALLAVGWAMLIQPFNSTAGPGVATLVAVHGPVIVNGERYQAGQSIGLAEFDSLQTGERGYAMLRTEKHSIRVNDNSVLDIHADGVSLSSGEVYIASLNEAIDEGSSLNVRTRFGVVRDIGTQFLVKVSSNRLETLVRKGTIELQFEQQRVRAQADDSAAQRVEFDGTEWQRSSTAAYGPRWQWLQKITERFDPNGKTVAEVLSWIADETGEQIHYANKALQQRALAGTVHGLDSELDPNQSLSLILATSDLAADRDSQPGVILIIERH